jgi:alkylation response protein AidB-like acyl-CoA dehydrogenase
MQEHLDRVEPIAREVVAEEAARVDAEGKFPERSMRALREAGLLGLVSAREMGGAGAGPRAVAAVIERLARECASTAMVTCMHYCGTAVIERLGAQSVRRDIAAGRHLTTLAFSESGSRSQFWAPVSSAVLREGKVALDASKSWVTAAHHADSYVWSSKPLAAEGQSTLWLVPRATPGLAPGQRFDGLGLRGNDSVPVVAKDVRVDESARLGADGAGLGTMLETVLPTFCVASAAVQVGLMESATTQSIEHATRTTFEHSASRLCELPTIRAYLARMRIATDQARLLVEDTASALETGRPDAVLRVLECKAAAGETATEVLDLAMRVCGGAAFRREVGVERRFRDARAGTIMAPTTDQLYDFIGKAVCALPLL